jgi:superfamily II DNA or RNA helicase
VLLQLPTGGGKTVVFSSVAEDFILHGERVLVLAHRTELIDQAVAKLQAIAQCQVGVIKSGVGRNPAAPVQVASVQTLARSPHSCPPPDLVIIDEAHHATSGSYRKILGAFPDAYQLGVTATPCRLDGKGLNDLFDVLVAGPSVKELTAKGFLCKYKLFRSEKAMATKWSRVKAGDYVAKDIASLNPITILSGNLVSNYKLHCQGKRCLVFAVNVEHSTAIAERYNSYGIPAAHLDGGSPAGHRKATLDAFVRGEILVLSNVGLFTEGFDLPDLDAVQIARPTKSLALWLQMVGRVLRPSANKTQGIILDHTQNSKLLGLPNDRRTWSLAGMDRLGRPQVISDSSERPYLPTEIIETDEALSAFDEEAYFQDQLRFAQKHGYNIDFNSLIKLKDKYTCADADGNEWTLKELSHRFPDDSTICKILEDQNRAGKFSVSL